MLLRFRVREDSVKREFAPNLRCSSCGSSCWNVLAEREDEREVREGRIVCRCGAEVPIQNGVLDFLDPNDERLRREVEGWIAMAGSLPDHLVTQMTALPYYPHDPWLEFAPDFFQIFGHFSFEGKRVIDLGAGRTWSSRHLATIGRAADVIAVDVLTTKYLGLETADIFFHDDGIFFERVRADLHRMPFPDEWADVVFSCASLHHSSDLTALYREARRVLRPGGHLIFLSEPSKKASIQETQPQNAETAHGINEHIYSLSEYLRPLRRAGFSHRRLVPRSIRHKLIYPRKDFQETIPKPLLPLTRSERGRDLLEWIVGHRATGALLYRFWSLPLTVIAKKSGRDAP